MTKARKLADQCRSHPAHTVTTSSSAITVAELIEHYKEHELCDGCGKTAKVVKAYRYIFGTYVVPRWGTSLLGAVKAVEVESWLKSLVKANRERPTSPEAGSRTLHP